MSPNGHGHDALSAAQMAIRSPNGTSLKKLSKMRNIRQNCKVENPEVMSLKVVVSGVTLFFLKITVNNAAGTVPGTPW